MIVTIVGAGRLAEGIAVRVLAGEHRVRLADAQPGKADALAAVLSARVERESGRPSPFVMVAGVPEAIAGANPRAQVVKAFNTTFASALVAGWVGGLPLDVFLAGDDARAKARVAALVADGGMHPVDTGPLRRARELEAFQLLHMTLQGPLGLDWASAIKLLP